MMFFFISERFGVALGSCMQNNLMPYLHEISLSEDDDVETFFNHQLIQFVIDISDALCHLHRHKVITFELLHEIFNNLIF